MGCPYFDLGIRDRATGQMIERTWSRSTILKNLRALQRWNARGRDIFIRPAKELSRPGLVLLDDLGRDAVKGLRKDGREPAAVVETSPGNFQAWVRVPGDASERERREISRRLAWEYDGDRASASPSHYGRLAGFTNQKEHHRTREGLQPFALLRGDRGDKAPIGYSLQRDAARELQRRAYSRGLDLGPSYSDTQPRRPHTPENEREAKELFEKHMRRLEERLTDPSRRDFVAALGLAAKGFAPETIARTLRESSPDLEERKRGHVDDYVRRTVRAVVRVHQVAREQERARARDNELEP